METLIEDRTKEMLSRLASNHLMAIDALNQANMDRYDYIDAINHLEDNTKNIAKYISEKDGLNIINNVLVRFENGLFVIKQNNYGKIRNNRGNKLGTQ